MSIPLKDLIGKSKKVNLSVDPIALKLMFRAAGRTVKLMMESDMTFGSGYCCETEDYKAAYEEFKKAMPKK